MDFLVKFPPNLEVLCLDFYLVPPNLKPAELFEEELYLSNVLANIKFPNLREVIVPEEPYSIFRDTYDEPSQRRIFAQKRKTLAANPIFKSGKVKLRTCSRGEISE